MTTRNAAKGRLLKYALAKPAATLAHPWGENVAKVKGKAKALLYAKSLPYVEAMGYGLGKSGWVSVKKPKGALPTALFDEWIDESYLSVMPKGKTTVSSVAPRARARPAARRAPARRSLSRRTDRS